MLFFSGAWWVFQKVKFRDVASWPKVEARILDHASASFPIIHSSYRGRGNGGGGSSSVTFEYAVDGEVFESNLGTPDGGGVPSKLFGNWVSNRPWKESWEASYKPGSPGVAVLSPEPYKGIFWLAVISTCGLPVSVHFYFWLSERIRRFRWARRRS